MDDTLLARLIREATESVFSVMLGLPVEPGAVLRVEPTSDGYDGVIALVPLGGALIGSGRVVCGARLACQVSSAMLMTEHTAVTEEVLDAVGELANMIIGNVKTELEATEGPLALGLPTVIFGRNYRARSSAARDWLVAPFQCLDEKFEIHMFLALAAERPPGKPAHALAHLE